MSKLVKDKQLGGVAPKHGVNPQLMGFMNKHDKVMTQNLTQSLVNHRHIGLAAEAIAKLPPHHAKGRSEGRLLSAMKHD